MYAQVAPTRDRTIAATTTSMVPLAQSITMAPVTFHLISTADSSSFLAAVRKLPAADRPLFLGHCEHWIHSPTLSHDALTGTGEEMHRWDHLLVARSSSTHAFDLPPSLTAHVSAQWAISAPVPDDHLNTLEATNAQRRTDPIPELPTGWSPSDHSGLDTAEPPADLEASLALASVPLGAPKTSAPKDLKTFIRTFGTRPVSMFNLLAYLPGQRSRYMQYVAAFQSSVGIRYGGQPQFIGFGPGVDWSSRQAEGTQAADPKAGGSMVWEDTALIWYPSIWHFGKMLDDPEYADVDREFKKGVLRDNAILCCTEVDLGI